jgi:hypothetical protein
MIYCSGDSYTAGTELIDHEHFKDSYPGFFDKDYMTTHHYANWWHNHALKWHSSGSVSDHNKRKEKEKSKAWPAKLGSILNEPVMNSAVMGASIESVVRSTIVDILSSSVDIKLVIILCPPAERIEVAYADTLYSISLSNNAHWIPEINKLLKPLTVSETNFSLHRRYLFSLLQIHDFCKNKNIKLLIIPINNSYLNFDSRLNYLKEHIAESMYPHTMTDEHKKIAGNVYCPGGHFTEQVHDSFAESLSVYIKEQKLINVAMDSK